MDLRHTTTTETRGKTINARSTLNFVCNDLSALGEFLFKLWGAVELDLRAISSSGGDRRDRQCLAINSDGRSAPKRPIRIGAMKNRSRRRTYSFPAPDAS